jgi:hypothetical protein
MSAVERLAILVTADGGGAVREFGKVGQAAERDLGKAESRADKLGSRMTSAGAVMMSASAVMVAGMWNAGQAAASLEQSVGGSEAVFKENGAALKAWAKGADEAAGLSEEAALRLTTRLGGALKGLGYDQEAAATQSMKLTQIAADLAATYGGTTADAVTALGSAYRGEYDPAEQFNLFLKQSEVDAKAVEMGLAKTTSEVDKYARAQAVTALIMEQSKDAQGQFARELDTTAGRLAVSSAQFENLKAQLGAGFLPVMTRVGEIAGTAATGVLKLDEASQGMVGEVLGWGTVLLGAAGGLSFLSGQVIQARDNFVTAKTGVMDFGRSLDMTPTKLAAAGAALTALAIATYAYQQYLRDAAEEGFESWNMIAGGGTTEQQLDNLRTKLDEVNSELDELPDEAVSGTNALIQFFQGTDASRAALEKQRGELEAGISQLEAAQEPAITLGEAQTAAAEATEDHAEAAKLLNDTLRGAIDPLFAVEAATRANQRAQKDHEQATLDVFFAQKAYDQAVREHGATSAEALDAASKLTTAEGQLASSYADATKSAMDMTVAATELEAKIKDQPGYLDQAKAMLDSWVAAGLITAEQARVMRTRFDDAANAARNIPSQVHSNIAVYGDGEAVTKFNSVREALGKVPLHTVIQVEGRYYESRGPGMAAVPSLHQWVGRAAGGPVDPWSVYELHDTPEPEVAQIGGKTLLFTGAQGGQVTNLGRGADRMTAGGGAAGGRPEVIQVVLDGRVIAEATRPHLRTLDRETANVRTSG